MKTAPGGTEGDNMKGDKNSNISRRVHIYGDKTGFVYNHALLYIDSFDCMYSYNHQNIALRRNKKCLQHF